MGPNPLVLVVAAHDAARARLSAAFVHAGWLVVGAARAADALQRAQDLTPECVVVDLPLPDVCGLDVVRSLAADRPVVALAAHRPDAYRRVVERTGCRAFLPSSVSDVELLDAVRALIIEAREAA